MEEVANKQRGPQKGYNERMRDELAGEAATGPLIVGITCIYVPVADVYESIMWYREILGCEPTDNNPVEPGVGGAIMRFPDYERTKAPAVFLVQARKSAGMLGFTHDDGNSSAVACFITPRIQEIYDRFKKNGVTVEGAPDDGRACGPNIKFYDPDGNKWEVWQA